jgi:hypothetical protein
MPHKKTGKITKNTPLKQAKLGKIPHKNRNN